MNDAQGCSQPMASVKRPPARPGELTQDEMVRLMRAFAEGKTEMLEDDALTLVQWAMAQRMGAVVLEMVLAGDLRLIVDGGKVTVALRTPGGEAA
jgi:hypothetical protein